MQGEPVTRRGSLQRRLQQAGLARLCVPQRPAPAPRQPPPRRGMPPSRLLLLCGLGALLPGMILLLVIGWARVSPRHTRTSAPMPEPPRVAQVGDRAALAGATAQNTEDLARILMSEASPGVATPVEAISVGYTVRNRVQACGQCTVRDVWDAYAHHATPSAETRALAAEVLRGAIPDPTGGATHFYSPRSMPMDGDARHGFDTAGGLEQTPGLPKQNYRPGWATQYVAVGVAGARASHYKFYRQPDPTFK